MRVTRRGRKGAAIAEFGPAMVAFVVFVLVPLIDVSFIPVRYFIAQGIVTSTAQRLSLAEKLTDANTMAHEGWWTGFLGAMGVQVTPAPIKLVICGHNEADKLVISPGETVPDEWLPNGSKGPCVYAVELTVDAAIPPLYKAKAGLPGFSAPVHMTLSGRSNWENLGRDPITRNYYINE
jgi:hypothetical protein